MKTSTKILLLITCIGLGEPIRAQDADTPAPVKPVTATAPDPRFSIGPKMDFTLGDIRSANLQQSLNAQRIIDPHITNWTSTTRLGPGVGFGAFATWRIIRGLDLMGELTVSDERSGLGLTYQNTTLNPNGNNRIVNVSSDFKLNTWSIHLPVLIKYEFKRENGFYVIGGARLTLVTHASMTSDETRTTDHYAAFVLSERTVESSSMTASMDGYGTARWEAVGGLGYKLNLAGHPLLFDLRVNLPLSRSGYYTTDVFYQNNAFENGQVLGARGKTASESEAPQYPLNDFRAISFGLSAAYALFTR